MANSNALLDFKVSYPPVLPTIAPPDKDLLLQNNGFQFSLGKLAILLSVLCFISALTIILIRNNEVKIRRLIIVLRQLAKPFLVILMLIRKKPKRFNCLYLLLTILVFIGLANLITPDKSKILYQHRLISWWNVVKPQKVYDYVIVDYICPVSESNPKYQAYYQNSFNRCKDLREPKQPMAIYLGYKDTPEYLTCMKSELTNAPEEYFRVDKPCPKSVRNGQSFSIAGIKLWKVSN